MIISVKEDYKGEEFQTTMDEQRSTAQIPIPSGDYVRTFDVIFDTGADTAVGKSFFAQRAYLYGFEMPQPFSVLPADPWTYAYRYSVAVTGPLMRRVSVHYKSGSDPTKIPIVRRLSFQSSSDLLDYAPAVFDTFPPALIEDSAAMALTNSADEQLDPAITKEYKDLVLSFQFWRQYDFKSIAKLQAEYIDSVNSDIFFGFEPGKVKCSAITANEQQIGPSRFWEINMEFSVRYYKSDPLNRGWLRRILDCGFRTKEITSLSGSGTVEYTQIKDNSNNLVSRPVKLDGHGNELTADYMNVPWWLFVRDFDYKAFAPLGLE
jgi:hypothetical protein